MAKIEIQFSVKQTKEKIKKAIESNESQWKRERERGECTDKYDKCEHDLIPNYAQKIISNGLSE